MRALSLTLKKIFSLVVIGFVRSSRSEVLALASPPIIEFIVLKIVTNRKLRIIRSFSFYYAPGSQTSF